MCGSKPLAEWVTAYPGVDVMQQLREMRTWCKANPTNRKTPRGINAFIVKWLGREQDKSGSRQTHGSKQADTIHALTGGLASVQEPRHALTIAR